MGSSSDLVSLVYVSAAVLPFSKRDLLDLLAQSRENNAKLEITGMLLFKKGNFLQALEGPRETVLPLYQKIGKDPRHLRLTTLSQCKITQRDFPDWSMGFHDLGVANAARPSGFSPFLDTSLTAADFSSDPGSAKKLLLLFKEEKLLARGASSR
jgi:hypothetical protein